MDTATAAVASAYYGAPSATFYDLRKAMAEIGHSVVLVQSVAETLHLLDTRAIKTIVVGLGRDSEKTRLIVAELRRLRPQVKVLEGGSPLTQVIEDNFLCFSNGVDGTVTLEQFREAFAKAQANRHALVRSMAAVFFGIVLTLISAMAFTSPIAKFFGAFWSTILVIEFMYVLCFYWKRLARAIKWLPDASNR